MSLEVKVWLPEKDCSACKQAKRIMNDQMRKQGEYHGKVMKKLRLQESKIKELEQQLKESQENAIPPSLLDMIRFLASTWDDIDQFVYEHCNGDALMKYPVIQGTRNQLNLRTIGKQPYQPKELQVAMNWLLREGDA